jgi:hypothetical protein
MLRPIIENERIATGFQAGKRGKNDEARLTNECGSDLRFTCRAVVTVLFSSWGGDGFEAVVEGEEEFSHNGG